MLSETGNFMQIFCHSLAEVETCQVTMQNQHTPTHVPEKIHKAGHSKPGNSSSFVGSPLVLFSTRTFHAFVYILLFFFLLCASLCNYFPCAWAQKGNHRMATTTAADSAANYEPGEVPSLPSCPFLSCPAMPKSPVFHNP